ncbi:MAG: sugar transferase [Taibaiella sp.]|nr:sugar transferase [Taibaiella sp.]
MQQADWSYNANSVRVAACAGNEITRDALQKIAPFFQVYETPTLKSLENYLLNQSLISLPEIVLIEIDEQGLAFALVETIQKNMMLKGLLIVLLTPRDNPEWLIKAKKLRVHDFYKAPYNIDHISERLVFLVKFKLIRPSLDKLSDQTVISFKVPSVKRAFDVIFSGVLLLLLSPLFLIVAILIRLESKGPIIYKSKRVGTGYKIFDFYKFRSMRADADKRIAELAALNQYAAEGKDVKSTFVKFKNDPRITRIGRFIRKTSIDELPQLVNIFKGDMSTVGNRPLPLYEAEMLTSQDWSWRFLAPAGLTGLWQISRRGKEDMSERERKKLDNFYAQNYSIWLDMKILLKTFPAMFQKEAV